MMTPSTVLGVPERVFCKVWCQKLWAAMSKTGRGFRLWTMKRIPPAGASRWRGPRRGDKPGMSKIARFLLLFQTRPLAEYS